MQWYLFSSISKSFKAHGIMILEKAHGIIIKENTRKSQVIVILGKHMLFF